jgi:hypothetical protein
MTRIEDAEELVRSVSAERGSYKSLRPLELSSTAFNDRKRQPSVDRRSMRASLEECKIHCSDGLVMLTAREVRGIELGLVRDAKGKPKVDSDGKATGETYRADVIHSPIEKDNPDGEPENRAHSHVECTPGLNVSRFERFKERLALLASKHGWLVEPQSS